MNTSHGRTVVKLTSELHFRNFKYVILNMTNLNCLDMKKLLWPLRHVPIRRNDNFLLSIIKFETCELNLLIWHDTFYWLVLKQTTRFIPKKHLIVGGRRDGLLLWWWRGAGWVGQHLKEIMLLRIWLSSSPLWSSRRP